ncbi:MAG TPA: porin, partial [Myxococcota bacterium]|nr:porin [Myxococcota bacterium]
SADDNWRVRIGGYIQADTRVYPGDDASLATTGMILRRARPIVEGTISRYFDFRVMPDFGGAALTLQDAYVNLRYWPIAQLQAGQFKSPFSLERLQSATALTFIERGFPTQLAPNRDLGVMFHGDFHEGVVQYQLAAMNGVPDGASSPVDSDDGKDVVARVFAQPFLETGWAPLQGLGLGFAASYGEQERAVTPGYRTNGQDVFFRFATGVVEDGERLRLGPQASYYWGPFGSMFEWTRSQIDVTGPSGSGEAEARAWQVAASWVLTGESASYRGITPRNPLRPGEGTWGAFELAARFHRLEVDDDVFAGGFASLTSSASQADAWTVGLNWYLNPFVKLALNYERTEFEDGGAVSGTDRPDESLLLTRFQLSY